MKVTYDPNKNRLNRDKHGLDFEQVYQFDFDTAIYELDTRFDYDEERFNALGYMGDRLCMLTFIETDIRYSCNQF